MQLSNNFTLGELTKSATAKRRNIPNVPSNEAIANLKRLAINVLQPLRNHFGRVDLNSGYRSNQLNKAVGGSRKSLHRAGCAADIERAGEASLFEILEWIYKNVDFTELIGEFLDEDGWIHVGYVQGREKEKKLKLKDKNHDYKVVDFEYAKKLYGD